MSEAADTDVDRVVSDNSIGRLPRIWLAISVVSMGVGFALTFDPSFADARSTVITLLPFVLLPTMVVLFAQLPARGPSTATTIAAVVSVAAWTVLVLDDHRWSALTFALYGLCFTLDRWIGVALSLVVTGIWIVALAIADVPTWRLAVPLGALAVGLVVWFTLYRATVERTELSDLVEELRATREELAAVERENGALEERARVAGEIHDTLAQGFTSIVLLARAGQRGDEHRHLGEIEGVATDNLHAARRLVAAIGPPELDAVSLPDAIRSQVERSTTGSLDAYVEIVGEPVPLAAPTEVAMLRGLQEALRNVLAHARATTVHVTLSYLGDVAVLDVADDGAGFVEGATVTDREELTGGQGLQSLRARIESVGGSMTIESGCGTGTVVTLEVPAGST